MLKVIIRLTHRDRQTFWHLRVSHWSNLYVFGLQEETGAARRNPDTWGEHTNATQEGFSWIWTRAHLLKCDCKNHCVTPLQKKLQWKFHRMITNVHLWNPSSGGKSIAALASAAHPAQSAMWSFVLSSTFRDLFVKWTHLVHLTLRCVIQRVIIVIIVDCYRLLSLLKGKCVLFGEFCSLDSTSPQQQGVSVIYNAAVHRISKCRGEVMWCVWMINEMKSR